MGKRSLFKGLSRLASEAADLIAPRESLFFKEFALLHLETRRKNTELRESTKNTFEHQTRANLIPAFGHLQLGEADWSAEFDAWVARTRKENEGNRDPHVTRFFNARKDLKTILIAAKNAGHISATPTLNNPDEKRDVGREMTQAEIVALLWKARRPFRVIFLAFFLTGCRPREVLQWQWAMLRKDEVGDTWVNVTARITKVDTSRSIPVHPRLSYILRIRERHGNRSIFVFPRRGDPDKFQWNYHPAWNEARRKAGIAHCVPYDMRRTRATLMAIKGVEISTAGKLLGTSPGMLHNLYIKHNPAMMKAGIK